MTNLSALKICFLAGTLGQGGAERQLFYQLQTLKQCGVQPNVVCFSSGEYWQKHIEALGVSVIDLGQAGSRLDRMNHILPAVRCIAPDIVQSAHFYTNLYAVYAARLLSMKEIGAVRNDGLQDISDTGIIGGQLSLRMPRFLAINSKNAIQNIKSMGVSLAKLLYLPNVVDMQKFSSDSYFFRKDEFHILMVGRLVVQKRFDTFLRIISILNQQNGPRIIGHIVGDGPNRGQLQTLAHELGLGAEQARFHGAVPDVERFYRQADVCLHISDWEGLPNIILEAMSCGLPVIASPAGGIPEIVQHGQTGFLVRSNNEKEIVIAITRLIEDPELRKAMGQKGREFIERNYALSCLSSNLESLYETVMNV